MSFRARYKEFKLDFADIYEDGEETQICRNHFVNSERKVLLQLRDKTENYYPSHWTLPEGKIEEDESPEQALVREV